MHKKVVIQKSILPIVMFENKLAHVSSFFLVVSCTFLSTMDEETAAS